MLKQLLVTFFACVLFSATTYAQQTVVLVNSPANIEGSYNFTSSFDNAWGVDLTTGVWTADAVVVVGDGTTAAPNLGCDSLINSAELDGKIAIVDRGSCNFSLKALNAQKAGAIAVVIINANPGEGPVGMGAGTFAAEVMIPVVMLSLEDGSNIKDEIAMGPVNMTIGTIAFTNDIGSSNADILRNPNGVIPASQASGENATFLPGAIVTNNGTSDATNVLLTATIDFTPAGGGASTTVYTGTETFALLEADSAVLMTTEEYIVDQGEGTYEVTYDITSDASDDFTLDNNRSTTFYLSDDVFTKAGWDTTNDRPARTNAYTIGGGGSIEFFAGFRVPMGVGYRFSSVQFYVATAAANLGLVGASNITTYVYEWDDVNEDLIVTNDEITPVAIGVIDEFADPNATAEWLNVELLDFDNFEPGGYIIPENDKTYFVGVRYIGAETVFFGFDENYDQNVYWNNIAPTLADLGYFIVNVWDGNGQPDIENDAGTFTDLYGSTSIALYMDQVNSVGENNPEIGSFEVYPNPTTDVLNVETSFAKNFDKVDYTIVNSNGSVVRVVSRDVQGNVDNVTLEVSQLPAGQYFLNVNTVDGSISKGFTVQR